MESSNPQEWKECKLEDVADRIGIGPFGSNIKVSTFVNEGIPVISGTHLRGIRLEDKEYNFITLDHANKLQSANVYRGDVIFTHAGNIGQVAFIPNNSKYERYIISQRQFYLRCRKDALIPEYLTYYFKSDEGQYRLLANANQTGVPSLAQPVSYLKTIEIFLPPLPEQRAIAGVLSSLDDKIDLLHRQNKTLEGIAEALWRKMFVEEADPGWKEISLLEIIDLVGGGTPKTEVSEYWDGSVPWLTAKDITLNHKSFIIQTEKNISDLGLKNCSTKLLPEYATIISARGTVGNYCILSSPMAFSQSNYGVLPKIDGCYFFTYLLIAFIVDELKSAAYGSVFDTITTNTFREQKIILPAEDMILSFEIKVKSYFEKIYNNTTQIRTLSRIRDTLLPKLMSRDIRVNNE